MSDMLQLMIAPFAASMVLVAMLAYLGVHIIARGVIFVDLALAQMAASKVAELEVQSSRTETMLAEWLGYAQPKIDEAHRLAQSADAAKLDAATLRQTALALRQGAEERASVLTGLQQQVDAASAEFDAARTQLEQARQRATDTLALWEAQRAAINAAGGRVEIERP